MPVALALCLLVGSVFLRSLRYGLASIVPIMMVVAWLYAVMYLAGFAINLVTATIAVVSSGIGIVRPHAVVRRLRVADCAHDLDGVGGHVGGAAGNPGCDHLRSIGLVAGADREIWTGRRCSLLPWRRGRFATQFCRSDAKRTSSSLRRWACAPGVCADGVQPNQRRSGRQFRRCHSRLDGRVINVDSG